MKLYLYRLSLMIVLLGALGLNTAVAGGPSSLEFSTGYITVSYADLNLANAEGVENLYRRVKSAANKVCGVENMRVSLDITRKNWACVDSAIDNAIGEIDDARLTALHQAALEEAMHS